MRGERINHMKIKSTLNQYIHNLIETPVIPDDGSLSPLDQCVEEIAQIVRDDDPSAPYADRRALHMMTVGELSLILENYLIQGSSPKVLLRGYHEGKVLIDCFLNLLLNSDDYEDEEDYEEGFLNTSVDEYFCSMADDAGLYAPGIFSMLLNELTSRYDIDPEKTMGETLYWLRADLEQPLHDSAKEIRTCLLLLILPMALYMRCCERCDLSSVVHNADLLANLGFD